MMPCRHIVAFDDYVTLMRRHAADVTLFQDDIFRRRRRFSR